MSPKTVFSVLLICMLVGTPMAANSGPWLECQTPGLGYPVYPLPRCRAVVKLQCMGSQVAEAVLRDCCQQLAGITNNWCRCDALYTMMDIVSKELGAWEGQRETEVFPGCQKKVMRLAAASMPAVCNVYIPNGNGERKGVCYWAKSTIW